MTSFAEHAETLVPDLNLLTGHLGQEVHRLVHEMARVAAPEVTPMGGAGDAHPGLMKRSWRDVPGNYMAAIEAFKPTKIRNVAAHALIIDRGRRRSERAFTATRKGTRYTVKAGKLLGSTQALLGVKGQVIQRINAAREQILAQAAAIVWNEV